MSAMLRADHWGNLALVAVWRWPNFSPYEMRCQSEERLPADAGKVIVGTGFMDRLQRLRDAWGRPLVVTSGYRTPDYNALVSTTGRTGPHTTGHAVDLLCAGHDMPALVALAHGFGFTGFGCAPENGFLHLDDLTPESGFKGRPCMWTY